LPCLKIGLEPPGLLELPAGNFYQPETLQRKEKPFRRDLQLNFTWLVGRVAYWTTMALFVLFLDRLLSRTQNRVAATSKAKNDTILEAIAILGIIALGIWLALDMIH
jgi:hypothetical protein